MRQCTRCIQTDAYPGITFDPAGVCSLCLAFDRRWSGREVKEGEEALLALLDKARRRNPRRQIVVGLSGGKDSCYTLHLLVKRYKADVLALTSDNGFLADGARKNIELMVKQLGVEHRFVGLDHELRRKTYSALVRNRCSDLCLVCMSGILSSLNRVALEERIPLVVWGLSPRTEPVYASEVSCAIDWRYLLDAVKPHLGRRDLKEFRYASLPWLFYTLLIRRVRHLMLPEYVPWREEDISALLAREYGWVDHGGRKHHFDCKLNPVSDYFMYRRLGLTRQSELLSQLVRSGQLTRDEALERIKTQDIVAEPVEDVKNFCDQLGVSRDELRPFLEGKTRDYRQFRTYTGLLQRLSWVFWLTFKLGLTTEIFYDKYRRRNTPA